METRDAPIRIKKVRRLDCIALDTNDSTYFTNEGYLVDHPVLTSCGIFEYTNPDGSIRRELRLPQNVFAPKSLKTYKGKPVIITHEAGVIDKNNVDKEQIGTILSDGYQDGEDVRAEIIIHDTDAMKSCGLKELSLGYNLDLIEEPGEWNGQPYDAIQTNIVINHLALVATARAGEQARLNIDGSDEPTLKGGKAMAKVSTSHVDGEESTLSPEELAKAVELYKASKAMLGMVSTCEADGEDADKVPVEAKPVDGEPKTEPETTTDEPATSETVEDGDAPAETKSEEETSPKAEENAPAEAPKEEDLTAKVIAVLEKTLADLKGSKADECDTKCDEEDVATEEVTATEEQNEDGSDDASESLNMDSADDIVKQRLSICRVGDKLHMDGLEEKSIKDAKVAIIGKVFPDMRTDSKDMPYINAMYDLAVNEVNKHKGCDYQRMQMMNGARMDSDDNKTMAESARQRMIDREGGK